MLDSPRDTLRYQLYGRPGNIARDLSAVPTDGFVRRLNAFMGGADQGELGSRHVPEASAVRYYMHDHAVALLRQSYGLDDPLPPTAFGVVKEYNRVVAEEAPAAVYYATMICVREARHCKFDVDPVAASARGASSESTEYLNVSRGAGSGYSGESAALGRFRLKPPAHGLGGFAASLSDYFYHGSFGGAYGGPPWGRVADAVAALVGGRMSPAGFLDLVWSLAHNGGPIFDKGMVYREQNSEHLRKVLDVQRAGMVPQYLASSTGPSGVFGGHKVRGEYVALVKVFGDRFRGPVDWSAVSEAAKTVGFTKKKGALAASYAPPDVVTLKKKPAAPSVVSISAVTQVKTLPRSAVKVAA